MPRCLSTDLCQERVEEETVFFLPLRMGRRLSRMTQEVKMLEQVEEKSK